MKRKPYVCPVCGEEEEIECLDYEWDEDHIRQEYICHKCKAQWDEHFNLEWTGYASEGVDYDGKGEKMELNMIEPPSAASVDPRDVALFITINQY